MDGGSIPPGSTISGVQIDHLALRIRANSCGFVWLRQLEGSLSATARSQNIKPQFSNVHIAHDAASRSSGQNRDVAVILRKFLPCLLPTFIAACGGGGAQVTESAPATVSSPQSDVAAFMGDSITQLWDIAQYDAKPTINFGVAGQTTNDMRIRFNNEVIASAPGVVVILGGINDFMQFGAAGTNIDNIKQMAAMASAAGIKVILCSVTPEAYSGAPDKFTAADIEAFNQDLISLAKDNGYLYADYYDAMLTNGRFDPSLYIDGLHPSAAGYARMWAVIEPLLNEDLQ
jgi:acyl-CoA thioesterase I